VMIYLMHAMIHSMSKDSSPDTSDIPPGVNKMDAKGRYMKERQNCET